jgi:hypothetical protein
LTTFVERNPRLCSSTKVSPIIDLKRIEFSARGIGLPGSGLNDYLPLNGDGVKVLRSMMVRCMIGDAVYFLID